MNKCLSYTVKTADNDGINCKNRGRANGVYPTCTYLCEQNYDV